VAECQAEALVEDRGRRPARERRRKDAASNRAGARWFNHPLSLPDEKAPVLRPSAVCS
jgi:hypothetical protein